VAFSPDGRLLASGSVDGTLKVWEADTAREMLAMHRAGGIVGLAFSPDSRRLAAAATDNTVTIWDMITGNEDLVLRGSKDSIGGVAFSPDGWRLATGSGDGALKIWDATAPAEAVTLSGPFPTVNDMAIDPDGRRLAIAGVHSVHVLDTTTGVVVFTLTGHSAPVSGVAYSPDGRRLAANGDSAVTIWEGVPLDAELAPERQAASLVKYLFTRLPDAREVSARVQSDATISDAVRQQALTQVELFWRNQVRQQAEKVVVLLFRKPLFRSEVVAHVRADPVLSEPVRQEALALAERWVEYPEILNRLSRAVAYRTGAERSAYVLALERAELACRLMPFQGPYHTTLGMAQYRLGKYQEALTTLTRADELNQAAQGGHAPVDLAFLAMASYQMREKDRAQASLNRLRETMQKPNSAGDEEARGLLKEAEALLDGRALQPEK
jgi:dipeptidyl aminopeptidase/acylaminoacyl peptidase